MKMSVAEIARAVSAQNDVSEYDDIDITNVSFDSRKLEPGSLFVPLVSENDGHDYVADAIENGAKAVLWQSDHFNEPSDFPVLKVDNTLSALQILSQYYLAKINPRVVAVTGSNGKTTTKDMIASILSTQFNVTKTHDNFNNEIGVPITILSMEPNTEMLVIEMGMDRPGQLDLLSHLVEPDIAIITMIGEAHIEFFGTRDKIADAKMEITHGLKEDGVFIYNGDEPLLVDRAKKLPFKQLTFGNKDNNDLYSTSIDSEENKTKFTVNEWEDQFTIPIMGSYNVNNALAALSVGKLYRIHESYMIQSLKDFTITDNRTEWIKGLKHEMILSDVYNSNPTAAKLVLKAFSKSETKGRRIAVLGDMLELGDKSREMHESLYDSLNPNEIQSVYLIGNDMKYLAEKLKGKYELQSLHYFLPDQLDELFGQLNAEIYEDDEVLLKASHGIHLEKVLNKLTED
ncbi:UDP-N-acetylmuramoyl-tripeptide--D-alanyl-D-alanine ligase [Apilactobacillus apisilvae]|uniref:UDP-N-acetylmuramoyl-tripeptide--D-alanyl-D-alanine ligase n=1 Tax=Apilactobacillus apisilvae TaxID=2923364 RepID=A0ABY4PGR0_9LACO|nr:UDP-N-acetylmuramoyl-tripeptide--D-alanyl-D-alanine ligase [Apilactobacillus apisilvae]UQS85001.1 UDP-N-acetylmuramoyl-tripeptide--D-alanyl-D-alanine ligase [Apilactobacillus apisilvae]